MKSIKIVLSLFVFMLLSVGTYANSAEKARDNSYITDAEKKPVETVLEKVVKSELFQVEIQLLKESNQLGLDYRRRCSIVKVGCIDCNKSYSTQYCTGGSHGTPAEWAEWICGQACGADM